MMQPCCRAPNFFIEAIFLLLMAVLRRFLRARSWQSYPAQEQFENAMNWRLKHNVTNLYATFDSEEFESAKRFYPRWTGRRDKVCWDTNSYLPAFLRWRKKGLPLYVYRLASLNPVEKELYAVPPERRYQRMYVRQFSSFIDLSNVSKKVSFYTSSWRGSVSHSAQHFLILQILHQYHLRHLS